MDPLTHAMSGALLARAIVSAQTSQLVTNADNETRSSRLPLRLQVTAGFISAAFPDLDFVLRLIDTLTYLNWHQGPTHSLILLPIWALLIAHLFARTIRTKGTLHYTWQSFYWFACLGLGAHIVGDLITSYGLMLFAPVSNERYTLPLVFVIDPWFSLIILIGLAVSWLYPNTKTPAIAALLILVCYVVLLSTLRSQALDIAKKYASTMPNAHSIALPQPLSPFHWQLIVRQQNHYHVALVNLSQSGNLRHPSESQSLIARIAAAYRPATDINWHVLRQFGDQPTQSETIRKAWLQPAFNPFRTFAQYPLLNRIDHTDATLCYWFYDMRFKFPELPPSFQFGLCRTDNTSAWKMKRHRGSFYID